MEENLKENSKNNLMICGKNAVMEAFKSGKTVDKLYVQEGVFDPSFQAILKVAKKTDAVISFVKKEILNKMAEKNQGVVAVTAAYDYSTVEDILNIAEQKGEKPFIIILDNIEDPHNLGAMIRTANQAGVHGIIIPKRRAVGLTETVVKTSAGAINYTPVARVTNISQTIEELKKKGFWIACADMKGQVMYDCDLRGSIALVIGSEGDGVSRLVKEKCDFIVKIPMFGNVDSLNASVAMGILSYEIVRQRMTNNTK